MRFFPTSNECGLLSGFALHCDGLLLFGVPHFGPSNLGKPTDFSSSVAMPRLGSQPAQKHAMR